MYLYLLPSFCLSSDLFFFIFGCSCVLFLPGSKSGGRYYVSIMSPCFLVENFSYHRSSLYSRLFPCTIRLNPSVKKNLLSTSASFELTIVIAPQPLSWHPQNLYQSLYYCFMFSFLLVRGRRTWDACPWSPSPGWQSWFSQHEGQAVDSSLVPQWLVLVFSLSVPGELGRLGCSCLVL